MKEIKVEFKSCIYVPDKDMLEGCFTPYTPLNVKCSVIIASLGMDGFTLQSLHFEKSRFLHSLKVAMFLLYSTWTLF